jgi:hypothetical protein
MDEGARALLQVKLIRREFEIHGCASRGSDMHRFGMSTLFD